MVAEPTITASIVVYNENIDTLKKAINSFIKSPLAKTLYIVDNSPKDFISDKIKHEKIHYIFSERNLGFGKGHNLVLKYLNKNLSTFHLILNPDIFFDPIILDLLTTQLKAKKSFAFIAPKILYPDKSVQFTARKFPGICEQIYRFLGVFSTKTKQKEYRDSNLDEMFLPDFIHGNFMLFKTKDFIELQGFDKRYFMYMEDTDICKRIEKMGKKVVYYPKVSAIHEFRKGSSKNLRLFIVHLTSMFKYYKKWGL